MCPLKHSLYPFVYPRSCLLPNDSLSFGGACDHVHPLLLTLQCIDKTANLPDIVNHVIISFHNPWYLRASQL